MKGNQKKRKSKGGEYGIVRRVALKTGFSPTWVSLVKNGWYSNSVIEEALEKERRIIAAEVKSRTDLKPRKKKDKANGK